MAVAHVAHALAVDAQLLHHAPGSQAKRREFRSLSAPGAGPRRL